MELPSVEEVKKAWDNFDYAWMKENCLFELSQAYANGSLIPADRVMGLDEKKLKDFFWKYDDGDFDPALQSISYRSDELSQAICTAYSKGELTR